MSYLLDTNVVSETVRRRPDPGVIEWLEGLQNESLHISVLTIGEIRKGIERISERNRKEKLRVWLETDLRSWFDGRVLPIDVAVAERWGRLLAEVGRPVATIDSLLAATALRHELRLVTRNATDFEYPGLEVVNPWESSSGRQ